MKPNNYTYHKDGANLSVIKIEATHCFGCGNNMDNTTPGKVKTKHHAIPEEMKPVRNIVLPVCRKCHDNIHLGQSYQDVEKASLHKKFQGLLNQFDNMKLSFAAIQKEIHYEEKPNGNNNKKNNGQQGKGGDTHGTSTIQKSTAKDSVQKREESVKPVDALADNEYLDLTK